MTRLPIKKILCPTDFSKASCAGLEAAKELAREFTAELLLVHAITPAHVIQSPNPPLTLYSPSYVKEMDDFAFKTMEEFTLQHLGDEFRFRSMILHGNPADEIVSKADAEKVDLIVIATHGLTGWRHMVFGSVAEKVVRLASCPVLTIRPPQEEEES